MALIVPNDIQITTHLDAKVDQKCVQHFIRILIYMMIACIRFIHDSILYI